MKVGIGLYPTGSATEVLATAVEAERLGFDELALGDSHLIWRELYTLLGAIAVRTTRIGIGPGVTHPLVRHPSLTASALATLTQLAPGRVRLGFGIGDSGPVNMGLRRATLEELRAATIFIRHLLAGETASYADHSMGIGGSSEAVPILIAGASDAALRIAGEVGDGALMAGPLDEVNESMAVVDEAAAAAGRPPGSVSRIVWTTGSVSEDAAVARDAVRPVVARKALFTLRVAARANTIAPEDVEPLRRLAEAYDFRKHMEPEHSHLVLDRWIDRFALAGTPATVLQRCRDLRAAGADGLIVVLHGDDRLAQMRSLADAVLPGLRA
ncbi:MAG TPA: LLM class flavin-dependent oxidoreductase [Candidatus Limnocylindria bacterium]|nr:LLM class flavin-dependent oxidoreductase [Candidatus Limnocylindria bacterium]